MFAHSDSITEDMFARNDSIIKDLHVNMLIGCKSCAR